MGNVLCVWRKKTAGHDWEKFPYKTERETFELSYEAIERATEEIEIEGGIKLTLEIDSDGFVVLAHSPQQSENRRTLSYDQPSIIVSRTDDLCLQPREATSQEFTKGLISDASICLLQNREACGNHSINSAYQKVDTSETRFCQSIRTHTLETSTAITDAVPMTTNLKPERDLRKEKGFAAAEAIQSQWVSLIKLSFSQLGRRLFQKGLINDEDYEKAKNKSRNDNESEAMEHVLIVAKRSVEIQPERFQDFCDALHSVDAHASENVIAQFQEILEGKGLQADVAIDSGTKQADTSFDRDHIVCEQEQTAPQKRRICSSQLPEDQYSPFSDTHNPESVFTVSREEQTTKCGKLSGLHVATLHNETYNVRQLLQDNAYDGSSAYRIDDLSKVGNSPLHIAARNGNNEIAQELLNHGANTKLQNIQKHRTPLHLACAYGQIEMVKLLMQQDEHCLFMKDKNEDTPMHTACKRGSVPIARALLKSKKCDLYSQNLQRRTPLHLATLRGSEELVLILLHYDDKIAFLGAQDEFGDNALHVASAKGNSKIIEMLHKKDKSKALAGTKNYDGQTPLEVANDDKSRRILRKRKRRKIFHPKSRKLTKSSSTHSITSTISSVGSEKEKNILYSSQELFET